MEVFGINGRVGKFLILPTLIYHPIRCDNEQCATLHGFGISVAWGDAQLGLGVQFSDSE